MLRIVLLVGLMAFPAHAAVISEVGGPGAGTAIALDPTAFVGSGECGYGGSVINDGCSVTIKNAASPVPYGRFDPFNGDWIDSQDLAHVVWTIENALPFTSITFALTDAFDQLPSPILGESFFSLLAGEAEWKIASRELDGTLHWLEVLLDAPTTSLELTFQTRLNDGWGVSHATIKPDGHVTPVTPVPLPAAGLLLLGGLGLLAGVRRRRAA